MQARAQESAPGQAPATWEALPLTEAVAQVFTHASGPVFAWTSDRPDRSRPGTPGVPPRPRLLRSDDEGTSWTPIALPPPVPASGAGGGTRPIATVDPLDPTVLYAAGQDGLYRSEDGGGSWRVVLATPARIVGVAASPAERGLVYLVLLDNFVVRQQVLRSRDAGATWEEMSSERQILPDRYSLGQLLPHPTDPQVVFLVYTIGPPGMVARLSTDQGATWRRICLGPRPAPSSSCDYENVNGLVAGGSGTAARLYVSTTTTIFEQNYRSRGALLRSDDGGLSWAAVLDFPNATPSVSLAAIALDATAPDRLYVALGDGWTGLLVSLDGGATWSGLGSPAAAPIRALAVSADGAWLYAATEHGLWRLRLPQGLAGAAALDRPGLGQATLLSPLATMPPAPTPTPALRFTLGPLPPLPAPPPSSSTPTAPSRPCPSPLPTVVPPGAPPPPPLPTPVC